MQKEEKTMMKAIALCFKPYLKPEEAYIYTNLERTRFQKKCEEFGIHKNAAGYFKRDDLDDMMSGKPSRILEAANKIRL
ncbi:hypothetical protein F0L74_10050 [Chitinophaga agrisoli]|uniref:Uncharacterized protein n=1 Tax=Chitinophaga agrisoli TaxID=2607653 RepID=A0A5B2VUF0_9BACT|nr:hypothetical protein [Chitinophaga agrisoli]KAA2242861.1 hypothetical protein F0L74_10050 [Chitinophaga agrisoli]